MNQTKSKKIEIGLIVKTEKTETFAEYPNESNSIIHKTITRSDEKNDGSDRKLPGSDLESTNNRETEEIDLRGEEGEKKTKESVRSARRDGSCEKRYRRREERLSGGMGWAFFRFWEG